MRAKYRGRKRTIRRRRPIRRRRVGRRRRTRRSNVQHYRFIHPDHITIAKGQASGFAFQFMLNQFIKQPMWDYYRLNYVVVKFIPQQTNAFPGASGDNIEIWSVVDFDDNVTPKAIGEFINQQGVRVHRGDRGLVRKFRPKPMLLTQSMGSKPGATFFTGKRKNQWINAANADVAHHGLKLWFTAPTTNAVTFNVLIKTYWSFLKPIVYPPTTVSTDKCKLMMTYKEYSSENGMLKMVGTGNDNCNEHIHQK